MADENLVKTTARRGISWRDVNGLAFVMLALGATVAFATLTEANYQADDAKIAAVKAEEARQMSLAKAIAGQTYSVRPMKVARCDYGHDRKHDISS